VGTALVIGSVAIDAYAYSQNQLSGPQFTANTTMAGVALFGGPWGAAGAGLYYGVNTFYPGGVAGALDFSGHLADENRAYIPGFMLYGNGSKL
jgi:hypothetical protein